MTFQFYEVPRYIFYISKTGQTEKYENIFSNSKYKYYNPWIMHICRKTHTLDSKNKIPDKEDLAIYFCFQDILAEVLYYVNYGSSIITANVRQIISVMKT